MQGNRSRDTQPEVRVRSALHSLGLRYRVGLPVVAGDVRVRPDVVFTRARLAVFIDGCFWHGCPKHGSQPRTNSQYWEGKLLRNAARDRLVNVALRAYGWTVVRVWEHEDPEEVALQIQGLHSRSL